MTSLAAAAAALLGSQTLQHPGGVWEREVEFYRTWRGNSAGSVSPAPGITRAAGICSSIPPLAGAGTTRASPRLLHQQRFPPNSQQLNSSLCPKPGKFYILSKTIFFLFFWPFLILPVVTLDIPVLRVKVKSLLES